MPVSGGTSCGGAAASRQSAAAILASPNGVKVNLPFAGEEGFS